MNYEDPQFKTGIIGEYLVKIRLNQFGINTGSVDKDTGTDIVLFNGQKILTAQVKTRTNEFNFNGSHNVHVHFAVNLKKQDYNLSLDESEILWKRVDIQEDAFKPLEIGSIEELFR